MSKIDITVTTSSRRRFTIVPQSGYTAEQIIDMLNKGEVSLNPGDGSIFQHYPPPMEGMKTLATVVGCQCEEDTAQWQLTPAPSPEGTQPDGGPDSVQHAYDRGSRATG